MSKVLVIPDIHLKPWIFDRAEVILKSGQAEFAIFLGDLVDDWYQQHNLKLYRETFDRAIRFAKDFPLTLWCYGNHDWSYIADKAQSGYSYDANLVCKQGFDKLWCTIMCHCRNSYMRSLLIGNLRVIDNVWFSHAGVTNEYALRVSGENKDDFGVPWADDENFMFNLVNSDNTHSLWYGDSPLWARPTDNVGTPTRYYKQDKIMQVVGHTPVEGITLEDNILFTDVFSTHRDGTPIGTQRFAIVDTKNKEFKVAKENN